MEEIGKRFKSFQEDESINSRVLNIPTVDCPDGVVLDGASWWAWNNTSLQARVSKKSLGIRGFRLFDANLDTVDDVVNPDDPELAWIVNKKFIRMPSVLIYLAFVYQNEMIMLGQSYTSLQVSSQE
jgi:hypothetical protein